MGTRGAPAKADWREARRKRAWELEQQGEGPAQLRRGAGGEGKCSHSVAQARSGARRQGPHAPRPTWGTPRLNAEQQAQIPALLARGAEVWGFRGAEWTALRVAAVIVRT